MFKNKCCDLAKLTDKFCGKCGTNLELAREREREQRLAEKARKIKMLYVCGCCSSSGQYQNYCTRCGKKMLENLFYFDFLYSDPIKKRSPISHRLSSWDYIEDCDFHQ